MYFNTLGTGVLYFLYKKFWLSDYKSPQTVEKEALICLEFASFQLSLWL